MLDRLFLRYLTKKGRVAYWVGQIILDVIWALYVFLIAGYSLDNGGETMLIYGIIGILIVWGALCLLLWKKPNESEDTKLASES